MRHTICATALAVSLWPSTGTGTYAQARPDSAGRAVIRVGTISVHAARPVTTAGGASALEVRLDSLAIGPAASMEQVLRELPLVQVRTNSRGEAQFSLRGSGSDARQVAVLLDGVPLSLGWDDRADLAVLPATAATSLTLVRGLPSVLYGPNVLGGVVEIGVAQTPFPADDRSIAEAQFGLEHTGAFGVAAQAGSSVGIGGGELSLRAGAGLRDRPGVPVPSNVTQPAPAAGTRFRAFDEDLRTNTDLRSADAFLAARYHRPDGAWAALSSSGFDAERGIAAELHASSPRYWRYPSVGRWVTALTAGTGDRASPLGGRGDIEVSIGFDHGHADITSYSSPAYLQVVDTEEGNDNTLTLRLLGDQTIGVRAELRSALTYVDIRHNELLSGTQASEYRQRIWSVAAETVWRLGLPWEGLRAGRLSLGAAFDGADTPQSGDRPALGQLRDWGARVGVTATSTGGALLVHAGASRRARFPSLRELYSGALGRFQPNPQLRPETLLAAEAGLTARLPRDSELQLVGFYRNLDQAIEQITLPDRRRQRVNLGAARSAGIELMGSTRAGSLAVAVDATMQHIQLWRDGVRQERHPEYQPAIAAGMHAHLPVFSGVTAGSDLRYVGRQYCTDPNRSTAELTLRPSTRVDFDVARELRLRATGAFAAAELRAAVDNVANAAIYDQCGLPQPGRTLRLQVRIR